MAESNIGVKVPAHVPIREPLPRTDLNTFEYAFSNPFHPSSSTIAQTQNREYKAHTVPTIDPYGALFTDGTTGAQISWSRLRKDSLAVASSLIHGPLQLRPAPLSVSDPKVNRGAVVSPIVLLHLPNCIPFAVLTFGILASGLTWTAANPVLTPSELAHILQLAKPVVIVTTKASLPVWEAAFKLLSDSDRAELGFDRRDAIFVVNPAGDDYAAGAGSLGQPSTLQVGSLRVQDWKVLLPAKPAPFSPPKYTRDEADKRAAVIFWSSGTSGKSKGVVLSHRASTDSITSAWFGNDLTPNEKFIGLPPWYHIYGFSNSLLPSVICGARVMIMQKFDPAEYLRLAAETKATHLHIAPPVAVLFAKSPLVDGYDLSSVRAATSGGAPLGVEAIEAVYKRIGCLIRMGYGLSETYGVTSMRPTTWDEMKKVLGTSGTPFPGCEMKIINVETGKLVNMGEEGEICIRTGTLLSTYLNNNAATDEALDQDGWFHTGDIGKLDIHGYLSITDRLKELIKVKGFQVSPADLEDSLCACPLVTDAGVTSIYHNDHATEYPRAYVVPLDKEVLKDPKKAVAFAHEVRKHIEAKSAPYKWLRGGVVVIETVPKSPSGKILRRLLKETKGHHVVVYEEKVRAKL